MEWFWVTLHRAYIDTVFTLILFSIVWYGAAILSELRERKKK